MGVYSGALSFVRYKVKGQTPKDIKTFALEKLKEFSFREIDPLSLKEKSTGWVSSENIASTFFDDLHFAKDPYLVFSLRRRVSGLTGEPSLPSA